MLGFTTDTERDVYLGSYLSLVVAVASLPLSAGIGMATDHVRSRQQLFVATVAVGAVAALATGHCQTYRQLVFCRWISGGCMTGSVPVAFSFLGDLFDVSERNAASSGLTAMMGMGIVAGQVYAGSKYVHNDWQTPFRWSGRITAALALICAYAVQDPVRGGREKVLQDLLQSGQRYDRQLTWAGFFQLVVHNPSNFILLWQGFFSSLPWGAIFVFMNDFLSQDRGFSVPDATYLVAIYGLGCALGGIQGGYIGQQAMQWNRSYLPLFMAITTVLGIVPFMILLNTNFESAHGWAGSLCALAAGWMASLPSVNARPCLLNVNPPESRGAALTAANLLVTLGRGLGPSCITLLQQFLGTSRRMAFNLTLSTFWVVSAGQLLLLMKTLPRDQDAMEAELAQYAAQAIGKNAMDSVHPDNESLVSIEERMISFDNIAAQQTLGYMRAGWQELRSPLLLCRPGSQHGDGDSSGSSSERTSSSHSLNPPPADINNNNNDDNDDPATVRRGLWMQQELLGRERGDWTDNDDWRDGQWTDETLLVPEFRSSPQPKHPNETTRLLLG